MAFDAFVLNAVAREIEENIIKNGGRLNRIYQLNPREVLLYIRGEVPLQPLFISIHAQRGRLNFTDRHFSHPLTPPPFCMLARKHLVNGLLVSLEQPPLERVLYLHFSVLNARGQRVQKTLAVEIMGRHSNLVLLDTPDEENKQIILGALKPIPPSINRYRVLLPNHLYLPPPPQEKLHPYALSYEHFCQEINRLQGRPAARALLENLQGFSPFLTAEIAARADSANLTAADAPILWQKMQELIEIYQEGKWEPVLFLDQKNRPADYHVLRPAQPLPGNCRFSPSISALLDEFYIFQEKNEKRKTLFTMLSRVVEQTLKKNRRKEKNQLRELAGAAKADFYRQCGELLLINLKQIPNNSKEVRLKNAFQEKEEFIKIKLDPQISPSLNAQRYFRKYRKARQGEKKIAAQLRKTRREITYLESVFFALEKTDLGVLQEIREELIATGYLPAPSKTPAKKTGKKLFPLKFVSSQGEEILAGQNNLQNEHLVHQLAAKTDLWLHVKDLPGAHVVVKSEEPRQETILEAALLAAYYSRGAHSSNVPVDYTQVKNVRRLGNKPGMVTYSNFKTMYVTPHREKLQAILNKDLKNKKQPEI
ncbi:MAG: fibronectin/fibrinogen-binding protein [Firmicutes bacterium]|nr:fibronectin/fibrinogen-binding protein [Bacillota bacterium]